MNWKPKRKDDEAKLIERLKKKSWISDDLPSNLRTSAFVIIMVLGALIWLYLRVVK
jgi:hypothetical protein